MEKKIINNVINIKKKYSIEFIEEMGYGYKISGIIVSKDKIIISRKSNKNEKYEFVIIDKENKKQESIFFIDKEVIRFAFFESESKIIFTYGVKTPIYRLDMNNSKIDVFNKDTIEKNAINSIKIVNNKVLVLDSFIHKLFYYDREGEISDVLDLKGVFEFPQQFFVNNSNNEIVFSKVDKYWLGTRNSSINKYKSIDLDEYVFMIYDQKNENVKKRIKIDVLKKCYIPFIEKDKENNYYALDRFYIYKFNLDMELIYRVDIHKLIYGYSSNESYFTSLSFSDGYIYIAEIVIYQKIYKIKV